MTSRRALSEIIGPWTDPEFSSGLISRCREVWTKPIESLDRGELAMLIRQQIALEVLVPLAKKRLSECADDDTESYDGELSAAVAYIQKPNQAPEPTPPSGASSSD